jgi:hypothetical protein
VSKSIDGGLTFADPITVAGEDSFTHFLDKPWLAADPTNANRLYVTYLDVDGSDISGAVCGFNDEFGVPFARVRIELVRSADGGATWSPPVVVEEVCGPAFANGSQVAVGPRGEVYVAWEAFAAEDIFFSPIREIDMKKSIDQGATFGAKIKVSDVTAVGDSSLFLLQGGFRPGAEFPSLAVDRSGSGSPTTGNVYIAWNDGRYLTRDDAYAGVYRYADVLLSRSTDGGATWAIGMKLSRERAGWFKEVMLRGQTVAKELGGCSSFPHGFEHEPFCRGIRSTEKGAEGGSGRKEQMAPAVGQRLQVADEFEEAELSPFGEPHRRPQGGIEGEGEQNEEQATREITERAVDGFGRERG